MNPATASSQMANYDRLHFILVLGMGGASSGRRRRTLSEQPADCKSSRFSEGELLIPFPGARNPGGITLKRRLAIVAPVSSAAAGKSGCQTASSEPIGMLVLSCQMRAVAGVARQ